MRRGKISVIVLLSTVLFVVVSRQAAAMHIAEGILPAGWAIIWYILAAPFLGWGIYRIKQKSRRNPVSKAFIAMVGAGVFVISCMPIPVPIAGTCSHPTGIGLAVVLIGPGPAIVVAAISLGLQALFLAHGGLTTLGANLVSMGVVGALSAWAVWKLSQKVGLSAVVGAFAAGLVADWMAYATTALQFGAALHGDRSMIVMFGIVLAAFVPTQIPLGVLEGFLSAGAYKFVDARRPDLLEENSKEAET
ncbi:MAG: energy-coupling factor ABC transporter permease [Planctomycetota bacterium]